MRAIQPIASGTLVRDGVDVYYEEFGDPRVDRTVVLGPIDPIVDGRAWNAQVPYLARHARVIVIDSRGNGRSGRPTDPDAYSDTAVESDIRAVMDALSIESAVIGESP